ncbi:MAG: ABC transporter ATP-binding protein [Cytophagales bacterium]|nr:ABC transporter ATP-binding protein [Armatimonadota bacterium]
MNLALRFLRELRPYARTMVFVGVLTIANAVLALLVPRIIGDFINNLDPARPRPVNFPLVFAQILGLSIVSGVTGYFLNVTVTFLGQRFMYDTRRKLYAHLQSLSQGFFEKSLTGKLVATIVNDVGQVNQLITGGFVQSLADSATLIGVVAIMLRQNWQLALLALSVYPIYVANYYLTRKKLAENAGKISDLRGVIYSDLQEKLAGVQVVKSYAQERSEVRAYTSLNRDNLDLNVNQSRMGTALFARAEFISAIGTAVILCVGGKAVIDRRFELGDLVAFLIYATNYLYAPTVRLIQLNDQIARTQTGLNRIFTMLDTKPSVVDDPTAPPIPKIEGRIHYDDVWFAYEPEQYVIKNVNLKIEPGQLIAFVGGSGSGKTTMINLLSRHYDVTKGRLTVDGHDVRGVNLKSLRDQISVVLQESLLFHTTIAENLRYGKLDATDEEVIEAARAANIHHVVELLPDGYQTRIGEDGVKLSVGEKQRMAIARAILADPRILVLDEATSSLDSETEALIQDALDNLMRGRTSFVIAHRLSTIVKADQIVVMEKGVIKEVGTHGELLQHGGIYAALYAEQFRAELTAATVG